MINPATPNNRIWRETFKTQKPRPTPSRRQRDDKNPDQLTWKIRDGRLRRPPPGNRLTTDRNMSNYRTFELADQNKCSICALRVI